MSTTSLTLTSTRAPLAPASLPELLPALWRDPHEVEPAALRDIIQRLEAAIEEHPDSADLRTCLGMAYAMNHDAYKSMDALTEARCIEPENFWAQYKFAELHYRLRTLERAEEETRRALALAQDGRQIHMARMQLQEIRRLRREGTQKPTWRKPLTRPATVLALLCAAGFVLVRVLG